MSMGEFEKLALEFNIPKEQLMHLLYSLNRCGEIVYLGDKEKNSPLADISMTSPLPPFFYAFCFLLPFTPLSETYFIVFLDCKWLANVMSSVISLKTRVKDGILNENYLMQISKP